MINLIFFKFLSYFQVFNQEYFICDWWFNFDCSEAEAFYSLNDDIAAEREAATQALLNGQASYVSNTYSAAPPQVNIKNQIYFATLYV